MDGWVDGWDGMLYAFVWIFILMVFCFLSGIAKVLNALLETRKCSGPWVLSSCSVCCGTYHMDCQGKQFSILLMLVLLLLVFIITIAIATAAVAATTD